MKPTNNDRGTACRLLRQLREQRGWSWADQARALRAVAEQRGVTASASTQLSSLQRSIARWESTASQTVPGERYQLLLAQLYARNGSGELALGAGSDFDTLLTALAHHGVPAQRTRELRDLVVRSTSVDDGQLLALLADPTRRLLIGALRDPRRLDVELIDHLAASVSEVDRQISSVPFGRLQLLLAPVVEVCLRLQDTEQLRARLGALRCDAYLLAGRSSPRHRRTQPRSVAHRLLTIAGTRLRDRLVHDPPPRLRPAPTGGSPQFELQIHSRLLERTDEPMLLHDLQAMHGTALQLPCQERRPTRPRPARLSVRALPPRRVNQGELIRCR